MPSLNQGFSDTRAHSRRRIYIREASIGDLLSSACGFHRQRRRRRDFSLSLSPPSRRHPARQRATSGVEERKEEHERHSRFNRRAPSRRDRSKYLVS